jgi:hypothetical protein
MNTPSPQDAAHRAIDSLLLVVARSAEDLQRFHAVVSRARGNEWPPLPRAALLTTERVVKDLTRVEHDLRAVLVALGLAVD